jgi:rare lipoprotein A
MADFVKGQATYYGPGFQGNRTSQGDRFNTEEYSAAIQIDIRNQFGVPEKTKQLGYARVTNLDTRKSILVKLNDVGSLKPGRVIDLSQASFRSLSPTGTLRPGVLNNIKVEYLGQFKKGNPVGPTTTPRRTPTPPPTTQTPQPGQAETPQPGQAETPQPGQEATESPIPKAEELTKDQIESFTQLIEDNPPEWESTIDFLKKQYPDQFGSVEPYTKEEKDKFSAEEFVAWQQRQEEWKRRKKPDVDPASETTGNSVILADPCKNNFFAQVESFLQNFFKKITKAGNFVLNLPGEIKSVVDLIGTASKQFIGQIMNTVTKALVKWINGGLAGIAQKIFNAISNPIEALAKVIGVQSEILNFSKKLFDAIKCLVAKISDALVGMIEDMIVSMVKNVLNVPVCAVQEFIGALTSKITGLIDSFIGPLLGPISKIIGVVFNLRDAILKGINTIRKIANLFKCGEKKKCPTTYKYVIDKGVQKDKDNTQQKDLLDKALDYSLSEGAGNLIGDFQRQYGKWSIFGETVGDSGSELPPCNTGNIFKCGAPKVEFFGGGGAGASGQVILGNFINKIDKDDIFGGVQKTASIIGVNITRPGEGYTDAPFVAFSDGCEQGYGAYGRAIIDTNQNSPTYGQVTSVVVFSEGENYPAEAPEESYIGTVVIENPGSGYADNDVVENDDVKVTFSGGRVSTVEIRKQSTYQSLPELNIRTLTGSGAILRPVMTTTQRPQTEVVRVIDCVL